MVITGSVEIETSSEKSKTSSCKRQKALELGGYIWPLVVQRVNQLQAIKGG